MSAAVTAAWVIGAAACSAALLVAVRRYQRHPDRVAHLKDLEGRYPLRSGRRGSYRPWN